MGYLTNKNELSKLSTYLNIAGNKLPNKNRNQYKKLNSTRISFISCKPIISSQGNTIEGFTSKFKAHRKNENLFWNFINKEGKSEFDQILKKITLNNSNRNIELTEIHLNKGSIEVELIFNIIGSYQQIQFLLEDLYSLMSDLEFEMLNYVAGTSLTIDSKITNRIQLKLNELKESIGKLPQRNKIIISIFSGLLTSFITFPSIGIGGIILGLAVYGAIRKILQIERR